MGRDIAPRYREQAIKGKNRHVSRRGCEIPGKGVTAINKTRGGGKDQLKARGIQVKKSRKGSRGVARRTSFLPIGRGRNLQGMERGRKRGG